MDIYHSLWPARLCPSPLSYFALAVLTPRNSHLDHMINAYRKFMLRCVLARRINYYQHIIAEISGSLI